MKTLTTPTSKQAVKETTFPDKLSDNLSLKLANSLKLRRNYFPWKASKNSSWVKSKKTEEVNKVRYKCFLRASEFLGEVS